MKIDCTTCTQREVSCGDCVVSLLMELPTPDHALATAEAAALAVMASSGLVPRLRLIEGSAGTAEGDKPTQRRAVGND